jgi:hypothetical protein
MAQNQHPILRSFTAFKQPTGVLLRWVIKGGQQCQGVKVYRSEQDLLFKQISHVEGICGSATEDETYTHFDNSPTSNTYNFYRLEMGFQGFTDTITVFFEDFGAKEHLVQTNYRDGSYRILYNNDNNKEAILRVFDLSGKELIQETSTNSDVTFDATGLRAGIYVFRISGVSETDIHGKVYFSGQ